MQENKKRVIFWGIIFILTAVASFVGYYMFNDGYGETGKIKKKMEPIVENFTRNDLIIRLGGYEAKATGSGITINNTENKKKFKFVFSKEKSLDVITLEYESSDKNDAEIISRAIIDSIYKLNGGTSSVFEVYTFDVFEQTELVDGVTLKKGSKNTLKLDINANIMSNLNEKGLPTIKPLEPTLNDEDLKTLVEDLDNNSTKLIEKDNIKIYARKTLTRYEIYFKNEFDTNEYLYESVLNVINTLNPTAYESIKSKNDLLTESINDTSYKVLINDPAQNIDAFEDKTNITKIQIQKPIKTTE